ncbi:MAG: heavy metal transporter [Clostridiales bacterium]|jgi:copper chaperone CopZ|nr:heavy metal transporter [Clostridiales bacterium]
MTKTYILKGLCCQNCAAEIEAAAGKIAGARYAKLDFKPGPVGKDANITIAFDGSGDALLRELRAICAEEDEDIAIEEA